MFHCIFPVIPGCLTYQYRLAVVSLLELLFLGGVSLLISIMKRKKNMYVVDFFGFKAKQALNI